LIIGDSVFLKSLSFVGRVAISIRILLGLLFSVFLESLIIITDQSINILIFHKEVLSIIEIKFEPNQYTIHNDWNQNIKIIELIHNIQK